MTVRTLSEDTNPAVERMQTAIMARLPAWRKLQLIAGMNTLLSTLALEGIAERCPDANPDEVCFCLDARRVGAVAARQLGMARAGRAEAYKEGMYVTADPILVMMMVIAALERLGVPYYIGGSLASGVHGSYRATADADIVADLHEDQVDSLTRMLEGQFYADAEMMRDAIQHRASFNLLHLDTGFKVDVFITKGRPFDRSQFERRVSAPIKPDGEYSVYLADAEGTILAKLEWYRLGNEVSDRQWTDIVGVLKVRAGVIDRDYLRHWAARLGLSDLLARAFDDAGIA
ncbi:MAG: hypothetical protein LC769_07170 [Chloroflexi bacterium]|nr:hypothetical protein [Chloroflexota bacterium]